MRSSHDSPERGKPRPGPDRPRPERQALLEAGAEVFGYRLSEVAGDTATFLVCEQCGSAPATVSVFSGDRPVDAILGLLVWCSPCGRDTHHIVNVVVPRPGTSPPPEVSPRVSRSNRQTRKGA
jgi:hypothetical protein